MISADDLAVALSGALHSRAYPAGFSVSTVRLSRDYSVEACLSATFALLVVRLVSHVRSGDVVGAGLVRDWRVPEGSVPDLREIADDVLREWAAREVMDS